MFALLPLATIALSAVSAVNGFVAPRRAPPPGWRSDLLESYQVYHTRYLAVGCNVKHNTKFFDACCHPMKKGETLAKNRPAQCVPSPSAASSASAAEPTSTVTTPEDDDDEYDDCDEEDDDVPSSTAVAAPTAAPSTEDDDDEDCEEWEEDDDDVTSSLAPSSTKVIQTPTSTKVPTPTSTKVAIPTSTKVASTTPTKPTATSTKAPATPSPTKAPTPNAQTFTDGFATFYYQGGVAGACGDKHSDNDLIAAMDTRRYGFTGKKSDLCGQKVQITNPKNGKSVTVTIADACPTCENKNSIDLSVKAFNSIATPAEGMVNIHWKFL
jgi:hypothetical protein